MRTDWSARKIFLRLLLMLFIFDGHASPFACRLQEAEDSVKNRDLSSLAERTVRAIRNKDVAFLSANIDARGVFVGTDSNLISAVDFRKQLAQKDGVYCVILDPKCLPHTAGPAAQSLRDLLAGQEVSLELHEVKQSSQTKAVTVRKSAGSPDVLFTLIYHYSGRVWRLQQFEYE